MSTSSDDARNIQNMSEITRHRIDWRKEDKSAGDLTSQIAEGIYDLYPEHQRNVVHNDAWKSEIIHSLIFHGDIPEVYFHPKNNQDGTIYYESLDGKQRCSAISEFLNDNYKYSCAEPLEMKNKRYSELPPDLKSFIKTRCSVTLKISLRTLENHEIEDFFQNRQNHKKTTCGEHLNSCITSKLNTPIKDYLSDETNQENLALAGFKDNGRFNLTECISQILRIYTHYDDNVDCSPTKLKNWYQKDNPFEPYEYEDTLENAWDLVDFTIEMLGSFKFKGGNSRKNVYTSCAWYLMNHCVNDDGFFDTDKIRDLTNRHRDRTFELAIVGGDHSGARQREQFQEFMDS